jgi:hypothetical protein
LFGLLHLSSLWVPLLLSLPLESLRALRLRARVGQLRAAVGERVVRLPLLHLLHRPQDRVRRLCGVQRSIRRVARSPRRVSFRLLTRRVRRLRTERRLPLLHLLHGPEDRVRGLCGVQRSIRRAAHRGRRLPASPHPPVARSPHTRRLQPGAACRMRTHRWRSPECAGAPAVSPGVASRRRRMLAQRQCEAHAACRGGGVRRPAQVGTWIYRTTQSLSRGQLPTGILVEVARLGRQPPKLAPCKAIELGCGEPTRGAVAVESSPGRG